MNPDKIICPCKNVSKGDILKAMEKGARTYKDVRAKTGAGAKCGKCEKEIRQFMKKHKNDS